jgi:hypothetical protein
VIPPAPTTARTDYELERIKLLFDYTKFHIGLYTTLAGVLVATLGSKFAVDWPVCRWAVALGIVLIALAGMAGGVVAATLPYVAGGEKSFWTVETGPVTAKWFEVKTWTHIEHVLFWLAVVCVLGAFLPVLKPPPATGIATQSVAIGEYSAVEVRGDNIVVLGTKRVIPSK